MRVEDICKYFGIKNYTINRDGTVDVDGDVNLSWTELKELPLKFGVVSGNFWCYYNDLTTLEGAPKEVGGNFDCNSNQLTTLRGAPNIVGGDFFCHGNKLTTLEGGPKVVGGGFDCSWNPIFDEYSKWVSYESYIRDQKLNSLIW